MSVRFGSLALLFGVLVFGSTATAEEGVLLKYQFPQGETLIYRTTSEMNQTMQVAGQTIESKVTQSEVNSLSLAEVTKEGNLKLKYRNHRLSMKADMGPAGSYNFDSESAEREKGTALSKELNPVYETLSGVEYFITITPQGKIEKLEGYKEILENILKDHPLAAQFTGGGSEHGEKGKPDGSVFRPEQKTCQGGGYLGSSLQIGLCQDWQIRRQTGLQVRGLCQRKGCQDCEDYRQHGSLF